MDVHPTFAQCHSEIDANAMTYQMTYGGWEYVQVGRCEMIRQSGHVDPRTRSSYRPKCTNVILRLEEMKRHLRPDLLAVAGRGQGGVLIVNVHSSSSA